MFQEYAQQLNKQRKKEKQFLDIWKIITESVYKSLFSRIKTHTKNTHFKMKILLLV